MKHYVKNIASLAALCGAVCFILISACSKESTGPEPPSPEEIVDSVIVVGTNIPADFRQTGQFGLTAVPLSQAGTAILSDIIEVSVEITQPATVSASVDLGGFNPPSNDPLAVAVDIDGSGSMAGTDPFRLRVSGAKKFVDVMVASARNFEAAAFAYQGTPDFVNFFYTELLQDFTSDADSLKTAFDRVRQDSGTPTYESLLEILHYMEATKPGTQNERSIVIFSDGEPNSFSFKDSVCAFATSLDIPIYSIGLGPASDVGGNNPVAVENMREIARCSGGSYAGINVNNDSTVTAIFSAIASATALGNAQFSVQLSGSGFSSLSSGDRVSGNLMITSGGQTGSATFEFTAP